MRIISRRTLREFWNKHANSQEQLKAWYRECEKASWKNSNELKVDFPSASLLKSQKVVFNIKGNTYRLIVKINFEFQIIWILFLGTHAEYDKINANEL